MSLVPSWEASAHSTSNSTLFRELSARLTDLFCRERSPALPQGLLNWFGTFAKVPDSFVLNHQSLDGFLLLRYLKVASATCLVGCCITWPVLFPINITGGAGQKQLNLLTFGNVLDKNRYYAHVFIAWIFLGTHCQLRDGDSL